MLQYPPQPQQDQQYQQYQDQQQQQIYQPIMNQQYTGQQEYSNYSPKDYGQTQQDSGANVALLEHINYVRTSNKCYQSKAFVQYQSVPLKRISPDTHPNHPQYYNFNVQANLPFRVDTIRVENLYDATRVDVYKECFLDPISEDNQFQGWSESRLSHHPFMLCIQELCGNLQPNVNVHIFVSFMVLALISVINIICLAEIINKDGNGFGKFMGFTVSSIQLIISVMIGLQITRVLRGFGSMKKLLYMLLLSWIDLMIYLPIIFTYAPTIGFLPIIMASCQLLGLVAFSKMNKQQILTNSQLYMLINGHAKTLY